MAIKFLHFPHVVLRVIVKQLHCSEIFNVSLCSERMRKVLSNSRFKKVKFVRYWSVLEGVEIYIDEQDQRDLFMVCIKEMKRFRFEDGWDFVKLGNEMKTLAAYHKEIVNGKSTTVYYYEQVSRSEAEQALFDHVSALFKGSPSVQLVIDIDKGLKRLPNIRNVHDCLVLGSEVEARVLDNILEKYYIKNSASIHPFILVNIKKDSKLFNVRSLWCKTAAFKTAEIIQKFTGHHLRLCEAYCSDSIICDFLRKWTSGESYGNLKTLAVVIKNITAFSSRNILNIVDTTDPDPLMQTFSYNPEIIDLKPKEYDCQNFRQIVRKIDSKKAVIYIGPTWFNMFVEK